jgi:aminoglycoside phosphotransferase (APT) family kinase protein
VGALEREGVSHGDLAPWNLLEEDGGFVLVDWESAGPVPAPAWDLWHWVMQAHSLLGRPSSGAVLAALRGKGPLAPAVAAYAEAAQLEPDGLRASLATYLRESLAALPAATADGRRARAARLHLLAQLGA